MKKEDAQQVKEILKDDGLETGEDNREISHLKTKPVPAIVMLMAGLIAAVYTYVQRLGLYRSLIIIFVTLIVFLILGEVMKALLDRIEIVTVHEEEEEDTQDVPLSDEESEDEEADE